MKLLRNTRNICFSATDEKLISVIKSLIASDEPGRVPFDSLPPSGWCQDKILT